METGCEYVGGGVGSASFATVPIAAESSRLLSEVPAADSSNDASRLTVSSPCLAYDLLDHELRKEAKVELTEETAQRFDVRDGQRPITFVGWMIADADSQGGHDPRWTELTLYKTVTGKYVLEKVGRSDVFHAPSCRRRSKGVQVDSLEDAEGGGDEPVEERFVPCPDCRPSFDQEPVFVERDISSIAVYAEPEQMVDSLFRKDGDNMRYLSRVARELLDEAATSDEDVSRVVNSPADIT